MKTKYQLMLIAGKTPSQIVLLLLELFSRMHVETRLFSIIKITCILNLLCFHFSIGNTIQQSFHGLTVLAKTNALSVINN